MNEVLVLFGEIFILACVQSVIGMFIDEKASPYLAKALGIAGYAGALLLVLRFVLDNLLPEIYNIFAGIGF